MVSSGLIDRYAVGGAWAVTYFSEPVPTEDLDVFCHLPGRGLLLSLTPIYDHLKSLGYLPAEGKHADSISIEGVPVQFLVGGALVDEALVEAIEVDFLGEPVWMLDLEYLLAIALDVGRTKDLLRIEMMLDATTRPIDRTRLDAILGRFIPTRPAAGEKTLVDRWVRLLEERHG